MKRGSLEDARDIATHFYIDGVVSEVELHGSGHINDSWRLAVRSPSGSRRYLLQRINASVFPEPMLVVENSESILAHLASRNATKLTPVRSRQGGLAVTDGVGRIWRMFDFIEGATSRQQVRSPEDAYQVAHAFGDFLRQMSTYRGPPIRETIRGFHDTAARLAAFDAACAAAPAKRLQRSRPVVDRANANRHLAGLLVGRARTPALPRRIVHNDAKIENVLFDAQSGHVLCVVDLDTVMPGLALYDFGDMARTIATDLQEGEEDKARTAEVDVARLRALASGYTDGAGGLLTEQERALFPLAARVITWEQAIRFLTDYLRGDTYYRVSHPEQNLARAATQLHILDAIAKVESSLS